MVAPSLASKACDMMFGGQAKAGKCLVAKACTVFAGLRRAAPACAGSELHLAVDAAKELEAAGKKARVVSMLSWEVFEEQVRPAAKQAIVLG